MSAAVLAVTLGVPSHGPSPRANTISLTVTPSAVVGGNTVAATVTLSAPAPAGGVVATFTTPSIAIAGFVSPRLGPSSSVARLDVAIPEGAKSAAATIQTFGVTSPTSVTLQANVGADAASASLTINAASVRSISFAPQSVTGGQSIAGTIILDGKAPAAGASVGLSATATFTQTTGTTPINDGSVRTIVPTPRSMPASVPPAVSFRPGASIASFTVATTPVSASISVRIVASLGTTTPSASFTVVAPVLTAIQLSPTTVLGGSSTIATLILSGPVPADGFRPSLAASSGDAIMPSLISIAVGTDRVSIPIGTRAVTSTRSVTISGPSSTPASPNGITDGTSNTVQVGGSAGGPSATLTILPPPQLQSIVVQPPVVIAGGPVTLAVSFTAATSGGPAATAQLTTDHPDAVQLPASVALATSGTTLTVGPTTVTTTGTTLAPTTNETVTVSASLGAQHVSTTFSVILPIASFTLGATSIRGGSSFVGSVTLASGVTTQQGVTFTTDHPELVQPPGGAIALPGGINARLPFRSSAVTTQTLVTITAIIGAQRVSTALTLTP